jgi:hypothetical protein
MADGWHGFFSDGFVLTVGPAPLAVDLGGGWDGVAFLLSDSTSLAQAQAADDVNFTQNLTNLSEVDRGAPISMNAGSPLPYWLECWRPRQRFVRLTGATGVVYAFVYRSAGRSMPPLPVPHRSGGRAS